MRRALGGPHVAPALFTSGPSRGTSCDAPVSRRDSAWHIAFFFLVAGQLRVTLLVRLTQCVQPMVGVTRYDLPVVDVILERPFTGYSGGRALVLQNHWGTLVGAPY